MSRLENIGQIEKFGLINGGYGWKVTDFNPSSLNRGGCILSPMVKTDHPDIFLRMILYPNGRGRVRDKVSFFIQLFTNNELVSEITANVTFFLLNMELPTFTDTQEISVNKYKLIPMNEYQNLTLPGAKGCENFMDRSCIIIDNNLEFTVCCKVIFRNTDFPTSFYYNNETNNFIVEELQDFKKIMTDQRFSDFTLIVQGKKICVHKAILANRSPVFDAMFTSDMQEKKQNVAEIIDIEYSVLKQLLQYIYTATVDDIENMAEDLLKAANKYCVSGLKTLCEKALSNGLNHDNVLKRLDLADIYDSPLLKMQAIHFIAHNLEIIEREDFTKLRSDIMCEVTRRVSRRLNLIENVLNLAQSSKTA